MPTVHIPLMRYPRREVPRVEKRRSWRHNDRPGKPWAAKPRIDVRAIDARPHTQEVHA